MPSRKRLIPAALPTMQRSAKFAGVCVRKPFFAVYSTFVQRAFDQCFQEVSLREEIADSRQQLRT